MGPLEQPAIEVDFMNIDETDFGPFRRVMTTSIVV